MLETSCLSYVKTYVRLCPSVQFGDRHCHCQYICQIILSALVMASNDPLVQMIKPFDPEEDSSTVAIRWEKWVSRFEVYLVAKDITNGGRKKAQLLLLSGSKVYDIYDTLAEDMHDYDVVKPKLANYFKPFKDEAMAIFMFREQVQKPGESVDQFVTRLRAQAKHCGFTDISKEIRAQVLQKTINRKLRREVLKHPTWTLNEVLAEARAIENSEARAGDIEGRSEETINRMRNVPPIAMQDRQAKNKCEKCGCGCQGKQSNKQSQGNKQSEGNKQSQQKQSFTHTPGICSHCGNAWPHDGGQKHCPAKGKECRNCGAIGHFASVCRKPKTQSQDNGNNTHVISALHLRCDDNDHGNDNGLEYVY